MKEVGEMLFCKGLTKVLFSKEAFTKHVDHAIPGLQPLVKNMERNSTHDAVALQDYCPS